MQATVLTFDENDRTGSVVLDDGTRIPFPAKTFDDSALRLIRPGQRLTIETADGPDGTQVTRFYVVGIGEDQQIR